MEDAATFKVVPDTELLQYQPMVQISIAGYQGQGRGALIVPGAVVCLYIAPDGCLLGDWIDERWNLSAPSEQILADLNAELPHMLYGAYISISGEVQIVCGELRDVAGNLGKAFRIKCNTESTRERFMKQSRL